MNVRPAAIAVNSTMAIVKRPRKQPIAFQRLLQAGPLSRLGIGPAFVLARVLWTRRESESRIFIPCPTPTAAPVSYLLDSRGDAGADTNAVPGVGVDADVDAGRELADDSPTAKRLSPRSISCNATVHL